MSVDIASGEINSIRLKEQISAPATPANGYGQLYEKGGVLRFLTASGTDLQISPAYILIQDQKSQNTAGGTFTAGAWRTRDFNTKVSDVFGLASVASNQITLTAGIYRSLAMAPCVGVLRHQTRLQNITANTTLLSSMVGFAANNAVNSRDIAILVGQFTLAVTSVLELQHNCENTVNTFGFGLAGNFGTEIYTSIEFWKVG